MNCDETRERLPALIDRELPPPEAAEVEKHLAGCEDCRKEKDRQEKFTTSVKISLEGLKPSERFVKGVIEKLPESAATGRAEELAAGRRRMLLSLLAAGIIIVVALVAMWLHAARLRRQNQPGPKPPAEKPAPEKPGSEEKQP